MDYDWRRKPATVIEMRKVLTTEHLYFSTLPWETVQDFLRQRESWKAFVDEHDKTLKTTEDYQQFTDYQASEVTREKGHRRSRKKGSVQVALRQFLRAYTRSEWGLSSNIRSYRNG